MTTAACSDWEMSVTAAEGADEADVNAAFRFE
jgi:hypothetical protein